MAGKAWIDSAGTSVPNIGQTLLEASQDRTPVDAARSCGTLKEALIKS